MLPACVYIKRQILSADMIGGIQKSAVFRLYPRRCFYIRRKNVSARVRLASLLLQYIAEKSIFPVKTDYELRL